MPPKIRLALLESTILQYLRVYSEEVITVGSFRRRPVNYPGDVLELLAIPIKSIGPEQTLFEMEEAPDYDLLQAHFKNFRCHFSGEGSSDGEYQWEEIETLDRRALQAILTRGTIVRLFMVSIEEWGLASIFRTGGPMFVSSVMRRIREKGYWMTSPYRLRSSSGILETPSEMDVFNILGMDYIEPERRN